MAVIAINNCLRIVVKWLERIYFATKLSIADYITRELLVLCCDVVRVNALESEQLFLKHFS